MLPGAKQKTLQDKKNPRYLTTLDTPVTCPVGQVAMLCHGMSHSEAQRKHICTNESKGSVRGCMLHAKNIPHGGPGALEC